MSFPVKLKFYFSVFFALIVTTIVFVFSLKNGFVNFNDSESLINNLSVHQIDAAHLKDIVTLKIHGIYAPLASLSFAIEYYFFKLNPIIYHVDNLALHLTNVFLVYLIIHQLGVGFVGSMAGAIVFGLHPIHTEPVVWISERKILLSGVFYLSSVLFYLRYLVFAKRGKKKTLLLGLISVLGLLSILAHPIAITLPFMFILLDWYETRRFSAGVLLEKLPLFVVFLIIFSLSFGSFGPADYNFIQRIALSCYGFIFYLYHFFVPAYFLPIYPLVEPVSLSNLIYLLSILGVIVLAASTWALRRQKDFVFALALYAFTIIVFFTTNDMSSLYNGFVTADKFMYIPSLGFCFVCGKIFEVSFFDRNPRRSLLTKSVVILTVAMMFFIGTKTMQQVSVWKDSSTLWRYQLKYTPNNPIALNNLANSLRLTQDYIKAREDYKKYLDIGGVVLKADVLDKESLDKIEEVVSLYDRSIRSNPKDKQTYYNLGSVYYELGKTSESIVAFQKAINLDPKFKQAYMSIGDAYRSQGLSEDAAQAYNKVLSMAPKDEESYFNVALSYQEGLKKGPNPIFQKELQAVLQKIITLVESDSKSTSYFNLGYLFAELGDFERAKKAYEKTIELNPRYTNAYYNLGNLYKSKEKWKEALDYYAKTVELEPEKSEAYLNMGIVQIHLRNFAEATNFYKKALESNPKDPRPYFNLAYISEVSGNLADAIDNYQRVVKLDADNAEAYYNMGNALAKIGRNKDAIAAYLNAIDANPSHINALVNLSIISFQEKDYKNAVKYYDQALLFGYKSEEGYLNALKPFR